MCDDPRGAAGVNLRGWKNILTHAAVCYRAGANNAILIVEFANRAMKSIHRFDAACSAPLAPPAPDLMTSSRSFRVIRWRSHRPSRIFASAGHRRVVRMLGSRSSPIFTPIFYVLMRGLAERSAERRKTRAEVATTPASAGEA